MKIVAKSIRDRVALIQWRRERIWPVLQPLQPQEQQDPGSPDTARAPHVPLQVQVTYHTQAGLEEPEADQHLLPPALPASATSLACECCSPYPRLSCGRGVGTPALPGRAWQHPWCSLQAPQDKWTQMYRSPRASRPVSGYSCSCGSSPPGGSWAQHQVTSVRVRASEGCQG